MIHSAGKGQTPQAEHCFEPDGDKKSSAENASDDESAEPGRADGILGEPGSTNYIEESNSQVSAGHGGSFKTSFKMQTYNADKLGALFGGGWSTDQQQHEASLFQVRRF